MREKKYVLIAEAGDYVLVLADGEASWVLDTPCGLLYFDQRLTIHASTLRALARRVIVDTLHERRRWLREIRELGNTKILRGGVAHIDAATLLEEVEAEVHALQDMLSALDRGDAKVRRLTRSELGRLEQQHPLEYL